MSVKCQCMSLNNRGLFRMHYPRLAGGRLWGAFWILSTWRMHSHGQWSPGKFVHQAWENEQQTSWWYSLSETCLGRSSSPPLGWSTRVRSVCSGTFMCKFHFSHDKADSENNTQRLLLRSYFMKWGVGKHGISFFFFFFKKSFFPSIGKWYKREKE